VTDHTTSTRYFLLEPWRGIGRLWFFLLFLFFPSLHQIEIFPTVSYFFLANLLGFASYVFLMARRVPFQTAMKVWAGPPFLYFVLSLPFAPGLVNGGLVALGALWFGWVVFSRPLLIEFGAEGIRVPSCPRAWRLRYSNIDAIEGPRPGQPYVKLLLREPERDFLSSWTGRVTWRGFPVSEANTPEVLDLLRARIEGTRESRGQPI
jgi:hypothetical protein